MTARVERKDRAAAGLRAGLATLALPLLGLCGYFGGYAGGGAPAPAAMPKPAARALARRSRAGTVSYLRKAFPQVTRSLNVGALARFGDRPEGFAPYDEAPRRGVDFLLPKRFGTVSVSVNDYSVRMTPLSFRPVPADQDDGAIVYHGAYPGVDAIYLSQPEELEKLLLVKKRPAGGLDFDYSLGKSDKVGAFRVEGGYLVADDASSGRPVLRLSPPVAFDSDGKTVLGRFELARAGGREALLRWRFDDAGLRYPVLIDPTWSAVGNMNAVRKNPALVPLPNGKVLVVGGSNIFGSGLVGTTYNTSEVYDPVATTWANSAGSMTSARKRFMAFSIPSNKVLAAGGVDGGGSSLSSSEIYSQSTDNWAAGPTMTSARYDYAAAPLQNGKILIAGGVSATGSILATSELYDPVGISFTATAGSMTVTRQGARGVPLPSGKVIVAGGSNGGTVLASSELYDPLGDSWAATAGPMGTSRAEFVMIGLPSGKVLAAGGHNNAGSTLASSELYDPVANTWSATGPMTVPRDRASAIMLDGKVLVAGGFNAGSALASSEWYDPVAGVWSSTGPMNNARQVSAMAVMNNGSVLIAGGDNGAGSALASSEVYFSSAMPVGCAVGVNVAQNGLGDYTTVQAAVNSLPHVLNGPACVVIRDGGTYGSEQVTVQGFTNNNFPLKIMVDPGLAGTGLPTFFPPSGSTAAFVIANASVTLQGLSIAPIVSMAYGILASSSNVTISSVSVNDPAGKIWAAGISISSYSAVTMSSITVQVADGLLMQGVGSSVSFSTAVAANVSGNGLAALHLLYASSNTITSFYANGGGNTAGYLFPASNNLISNSTFAVNSNNPAFWIAGFNGQGNTLTRSVVSNSGTGDGVFFGGSYDTFSFDSVTSNGAGGACAVHFSVSSYTLLSADFVQNPAGCPMALDPGANLNTISLSTITGNSGAYAALHLTGAGGNAFSQDFFYNALNTAVLIDGGASANTISQSTITANSTAVALSVNGASSNTVSSTYITAPNAIAVSLDNFASSNTFTNDTIVNGAVSGAAFNLLSPYNTITQSRIDSMNGTGLWVTPGAGGSAGKFNTISQSTITSEHPLDQAIYLGSSSNTISQCYFQNLVGYAVYEGSVGNLITQSTLWSSTNAANALFFPGAGASNNTVTQSFIVNTLGAAVSITGGSGNNSITQSTITARAQKAAIELISTSFNTIAFDYFENMTSTAVYLGSANYNTISQSTVAGGGPNPDPAVLLTGSSSNTLTQLSVSNANGYTVQLGNGSNNNALSSSTFTGNGNPALVVFGSGYNTFSQMTLIAASGNGTAWLETGSNFNLISQSFITGLGGQGAVTFTLDNNDTVSQSTITSNPGNQTHYGFVVQDGLNDKVDLSYIQGANAAVLSSFLGGSTGTVISNSVLVATNTLGDVLEIWSGNVNSAISSNTLIGGAGGIGVRMDYGSKGTILQSELIKGSTIGISIAPQADNTLVISSATFSSLSAGATAINFLGGTSVSTFSGVFFDNSVAINVNASLLTASAITMNGYSGPKAGPVFDIDPLAQVSWYGAPTANIALPPGPPTPYVATLKNIIGNAQAFNGNTVSNVAVSIQRLSDGFYWTGSAFAAGPTNITATLAGGGWNISNGPGSNALTTGVNYKVSAQATDSANIIGLPFSQTYGAVTFNASGNFAGGGANIHANNGQHSAGAAIAVDNVTGGGPYTYVGVLSTTTLAFSYPMEAVVKYDAGGNFLGVVNLFGNAGNIAPAVDNSGNIYVADRWVNPPLNQEWITITKYNSSLVQLAQIYLSTMAVGNVSAMTSDGVNLYTINDGSPAAGGDFNAKVIKYNSSLVATATGTYVGPVNTNAHGISIAIDGVGKAYVVVSTGATPGAETHLVKYNAALTQVWDSTITALTPKVAASVAVSTDGALVYTGGYDMTGTVVYVNAYNAATGAYTGMTSTTTGAFDPLGFNAAVVRVAPSGNVYLGYTDHYDGPTFPGHGDYQVVKLTRNLQFLLSQAFNGVAGSTDSAVGMAVLDSSNVVVTGGSTNLSNALDAVTVKMSLPGGGAQVAAAGADISLSTVASVGTNLPLLQLALTGQAGSAAQFNWLQVGLTGNAPANNVTAGLWKDSGSGSFNPGLSILLSTAAFGLGTPPLAFLPADGGALGGSPATYYVTVSYSTMSIGRQFGVIVNDPSFIGMTPGFVSPSTIFPIQSGFSTVQQVLFANPAAQGYPTPTAPAGALGASGGFDTGFAVQTGQAVVVTATGTWSSGALAGTVTADGIATTGGLGAGLRQGSLVGRVGSGNWFQLGTNNAFTAAGAGDVILAMNDTYYLDNSGSISVGLQVQVSTVPKIWTGGSGVNANASTNGNWLNNLPPAPGDNVIFDGSHNAPCNWDIYGANIGLLRMTTSYSQTVTVAPAAYQLTASSDVVVSSGSLVLGAGVSLTVQGKLDIPSGVFDMGAGGGVLKLGAKGINVSQGGVFKSLGASTVTIAAINPNVPFPFVNRNSTLNIKNSQQTQIWDVASVTIGTQTNLQALSNVAFLNSRYNFYPSIYLVGCASASPCLLGGFNNDFFDMNVSTNVDASALVAGSTVPVNNASGPRFGSPFDRDPNRVVQWSPDGGGTGSISGTLNNFGGQGLGSFFIAAVAGPTNYNGAVAQVGTAGLIKYQRLDGITSSFFIGGSTSIAAAGTYQINGLAAPNTYYLFAWRDPGANNLSAPLQAFDPRGGFNYPNPDRMQSDPVFLGSGANLASVNITINQWSQIKQTVANNSNQFGPVVIQSWQGVPLTAGATEVAETTLPPLGPGGATTYILDVPPVAGQVLAFVDVDNNRIADAFEATGSQSYGAPGAGSTSNLVGTLSITGGGSAPGGVLTVGTANPFSAHQGAVGYIVGPPGPTPPPFPQPMMRLNLSNATGSTVTLNSLRVDLSVPAPQQGLNLQLWRDDGSGHFDNPFASPNGPYSALMGSAFVPPGASSGVIVLASPESWFPGGPAKTCYVTVDLSGQSGNLSPFEVWIATSAYFGLSQGAMASQPIYTIQTASAAVMFAARAQTSANGPSVGGNDTGIFLAPGQNITITAATGTWNVSNTQTTGPGGVALSSGGAFVVPQANLGQLIGRVGDPMGNGSPWFPIVASAPVPAPAYGDLWLAMNDNANAYFTHSGAVYTTFGVSGSTTGAISGTIVYVGTVTTGNLFLQAAQVPLCALGPNSGPCPAPTVVATQLLPLAGGTTLYNYIFPGLPSAPGGYSISAVVQNGVGQQGGTVNPVSLILGSTVAGINFPISLGLGTLSGTLVYTGPQAIANFGLEFVALNSQGFTIAVVNISTPHAGAFTVGNLPTPATYTIFAFGDVFGNMNPQGTDPYSTAPAIVFLDTGAVRSAPAMNLLDTGQLSGNLTLTAATAGPTDIVVQVGEGDPTGPNFIINNQTVYRTLSAVGPGTQFGYNVGLLDPATDYSVVAFLSPDFSDLLSPGNPVAVDRGPLIIAPVAHVLDNLMLSGNTAPPPPPGFFGKAVSTDTVLWNWNSALGAGQYLLKNGAGATVATLGQSATFYFDSGLGFNANSSIRQIVSSNTFGPSSAVFFSTVASLAATAGQPAFTSIQQSSVTLSWPANGDSAQTLYLVQRATAAAGPYATAFQTTALSGSDTALVPSTVYFWRVQAVNANGISALPGATTTAMTLAPAGPSIAGTLAYNGRQNGAIAVQVALSTSFAPLTAAVSLPNTASQSYFVAVPPSATYFVRSFVDVYGDGNLHPGEDNSGAASVSVGASPVTGFNLALSSSAVAPASPLALSYQTPQGLVALSWNAPGFNANGTPLVDLAGFRVYRSSLPAGPFAVISTSTVFGTTGTVATASFNDFAPFPNVLNYYRVTAVDFAANESAPSGGVAVLPYLGAQIAGQVRYFGTTNSGGFHVRLSTTPDVRSSVSETTLTQFAFTGLSDGTYFVEAFRDLAGTGQPADGDPGGNLGGLAAPYPISIVGGNSVTGATVAVCDRNPVNFGVGAPNNVSVSISTNSCPALDQGAGFYTTLGSFRVGGGAANSVGVGAQINIQLQSAFPNRLLLLGPGGVVAQDATPGGARIGFQVNQPGLYLIEPTSFNPGDVGPLNISLAVNGGFNGSISGNVSYNGAQGGKVFVQLFNTPNPPSQGGFPIQQSTFAAPGAYSFAGLPDGVYFLRAFRDAQNDFHQDPGDPSGVFGASASSLTAVAIQGGVTFVNGSSNPAVNITLSDPAVGTISGQIVRQGSQQGAIFVVVGQGQLNNGFQPVSFATVAQTGSGTYPYTLAFVPPATNYTVAAFVDVAGTGKPLPLEAFGSTAPISVLANQVTTVNLLVSDPGSGAFGNSTLQGTVSYGGASTGPLLMGFATDPNFNSIAYLLSQSSTGTYVKSGIVGGTSYYIAAFLDTNLNGEPDDKLGEPIGFFGANPANDFSSKQPVFVPNNGAATANLTLSDAPSGQIGGQVTYSGGAPLNQNIIVKAYLPAGGHGDFSSQQVTIPRAPGVNTYNFSLPFLNAATNYTVAAFIDALGNGQQAPGEPNGFFGQVTCIQGNGCFGAPVAVSSGPNTFPVYGVNIQLNDPNQAPGNFNNGAINVSITYFGVQGGPIVVRLFSTSTYVGAPVISQAFPVPPGSGFYSFNIPNVPAGTYYVDAFRDTSGAGIFNPAFQAYVQAGAVTLPAGQSFPQHIDAPAMADPGAGGSVNVYSGSFTAVGGARFDGGATDIVFDMTGDSVTAGGPYIYVNGITDQQPVVPSLVKYSSAGLFITSATVAGGGPTNFFFPVVDPVGGYVYMTGRVANGGSNVLVSTAAILQMSTSLKVLNTIQLTPADPNWGAQSAQSLQVFNGFIWVGVRSSQLGGQLLRKINPSNWVTVATGTFAFPAGAAVCSSNCSGTRVNSIAIDTNTASVYALFTFDPGGPGKLAALAKFDSNLNLLLTKDITGLNPPTGEKGSASLTVDQLGNVFLAFVPLAQTGAQTASTYKFNSSLQQTAYTTYSPILTHFSFSKLAIGPDNSVYETAEVPSNGGDYGVLRYDSNLNLLNTQTFDGGLGLEDAPAGLFVQDSSHVFVAGTVNSGRNLDWASLVFNLNNSGSSSGAGQAVVITTANAVNPIFGTLSYGGSLASSGTVRAALFQAGNPVPVRFSSAPFAASVPYLFNNVPPGTYQLKAFIDLNGNFLADAGEPVGVSVSNGFFVNATTATPLNVSLCDRRPVIYGQTLTDTITGADCALADQNGAFARLYTFAGARGQAVTINATAVNFTDVPIKLYDPNNNLVAADDGSAGNGNSRITNLLLPQDGLYTIGVSPFSSAITSATFKLALGNSAGAVGSIAGNIAYTGVEGGRMFVGLFTTTTFLTGTSQVVASLVLPGPGAFTLANLPSGTTYYLGAFIDVNGSGNFVLGDDFGFFGSSTVGPAPIFLRSGQNVGGVNFTIFGSSSSAGQADIAGVVSYAGTQNGQLHVEAWSNSAFQGQPVAGRVIATGAGPYDVLVPGSLPYYLRAWLDVNNTFVFSANDPVGFYTNGAGAGQGAQTLFAPSSGSLVGVNFAIADPGTSAGGIAGEGTATMVPSTAAAGAQVFSATITYTAGAHGLQAGATVAFIIAPGFPSPAAALITTTGSVAAAALSPVSVTPVAAQVYVLPGQSVAAGQTIVFNYTQGPAGCLVSTQTFVVTESQNGAVAPQPLFAGSPSLQVVQGPPVFLQPSNPYLSLTQGVVSDPQRLLTMDACGNVSPVTATQGAQTVNLSGQVFSVNSSTFVPDATVGLTTGPTVASGNSINLTFVVGQSSATFFAVSSSTGFKNIKATFNLGQPTTFFYGLTVLPNNALTGVSISTFSSGTGQKSAAIQPNGSGIADFAFINFTLADPTQPWDVMVSSLPFKAGVVPNPIWQSWGQGQPNLGQVAWDGRFSPWINNGARVPSGLYFILVEVAGGGVHDDSLAVFVTASQVAGKVLDSGVTPNVPLSGVNLSVFGPNGNIVTGSDSGGNYALPGVQAGGYNMTVSRQDFLTGNLSLTVSTGGTVSTFTALSGVTASTNASGGIDVLMSRASVLLVSPSVVNFSTAASDIFGGLQVTPSTSAANAQSIFSPLRLPAGTTTFDDGGQWDPGLQQFITHTIFRFGVAPGTYTVQAFLPSFSLSSATVYVGSGLNAVALQLTPQSSISGAVTLPSNPSGNFVSIFAQPVSTAAAAAGSGTGVQLAAGVLTGTYTVQGLAPGLYILGANANGLAPVTTGPISVPAGTNVAGVNFPAFGAGSSLSGAITFNFDTTGRTIALSVNAWAPPSSFGSTNVFLTGGAPGASVPYSIGGLSAGTTYQLYVGINGYNGPSLPNAQVLGGLPATALAPSAATNFTFFASSGSIAGTLILPAGNNDFGNVSLQGQTIASLDPTAVGHQFTVQSSTQLPGFLCTANNAPANAATGLCPVGNSSATINVQGLNTETDQITFFYATTGQSKATQVSVVNGGIASVVVDLSAVTFSISGAINNQITNALFNTNPNIVANAPLIAPVGYPANISSTTARVEAVAQSLTNFNVAISTVFNPATTHVGFLTSAGTFTITGVPAGVYFVRTVPLRACATCSVVVPAVGQIVNVAGANVSSVTLTLNSGYSASGAISLVDASGNPLRASTKFDLTVRDQRQQVVASTAVVLGDGSGQPPPFGVQANSVNYAFTNLPAGNFYTLSVADEGQQFFGQPIKFPDPGLSPNGLQSNLSAQNVTMQVGAYIRGRLQDANTGALITTRNGQCLTSTLLAPNFSITATANPWVEGGFATANLDNSGLRPSVCTTFGAVPNNFVIGPLLANVSYDITLTQKSWDPNFLAQGSQNYAPVTISGVKPQASQSLDLGIIQLKQGQTISGNVTTSSPTVMGLGNIQIAAQPSFGNTNGLVVQTYTNQSGHYSLWVSTAISTQYDITAAPRSGNVASNGTAYGQVTLNHVNLLNTTTADFLLQPLVSNVTGQVVVADAATGGVLKYPFGAQKGFPAAAVFLQPLGVIPLQNPLGDIPGTADSQGNFSIVGLSTGNYMLRAVSLGYAVFTATVTIDPVMGVAIYTGANLPANYLAGNIITLQRGASITGRIVRSDGSLPNINEVGGVAAANFGAGEYVVGAANVAQDKTITDYTISGFKPGIAYTIVILPANKADDAIFPSEGAAVQFAAQESTATKNVNLTFTAPAMLCTATSKAIGAAGGGRFQIKIDCNKPLRNQTQADNDLSQIITVSTFSSAGTPYASPNGTGQFNGSDKTFSNDRRQVTAIYTIAPNETAFSIAFKATANSIDAHTGANFTATQIFDFFTGIPSNVTRRGCNMNGLDLDLPASDTDLQQGVNEQSGVTLPPGSFVAGTDPAGVDFALADITGDPTVVAQASACATIGIQKAAPQNSQSVLALKSMGVSDTQIRTLANPSAYPSEMAAAMMKLGVLKGFETSAASTITITGANPLSSFYAIFLPAGIRHQLKKAADLKLTLTQPCGANPDNINVWFYDATVGKFVKENANRRLDCVNKTITVAVKHFSTFVVLDGQPTAKVSNPISADSIRVINFPNPSDCIVHPGFTTNSALGGQQAVGPYPGTMIRFMLPGVPSETHDATIRVYNLAGELVRTMSQGPLAGGFTYYTPWNCNNDSGRAVASGVYLGEVEWGNRRQFVKMAIIKGSNK